MCRKPSVTSLRWWDRKDATRIDNALVGQVRFARSVSCALLFYAFVFIPERLPNAVTVDAREAARTIEKRQSHRDFLKSLTLRLYLDPIGTICIQTDNVDWWPNIFGSLFDFELNELSYEFNC